VLVQQQGTLKRGWWALERLPEDRDEHLATLEVGKCVTQSLGAAQRVVLVPALLEAWRGGEVVVGTECDNDEIGVVAAGVRGHTARDGVDACHCLLAELDAVLLDVAVVDPDVIGRLAAEHHLELGETEKERVVAVDQCDLDRVCDRLREPCRKLQSAEPGTEDQDVLAHQRHTTRPIGPSLWKSRAAVTGVVLATPAAFEPAPTTAAPVCGNVT
jgi:hypothetical protein